ncbi:hypothetical protein [Pseudomonas sp. Ga0074129]|uniref:hypothetical protein n=1 Tax=Pseudomonas sp. Ga0074129 TaxID=1752219 RepID=UPI000AE76349|nr:hypothetical protein [Pseudomonas sp. Ga0074129]
MNILNRLALGIELPFITTEAKNYSPPTWPPTPDYPVVIDRDGNIISRYGDAVWILDAWAGRRLQLDFRPSGARGVELSERCIEIAKLVAAWWLWGPRPVTNAGTLKARFTHLFPLFKMCSAKQVDPCEIYKHPKELEDFPNWLSSSHAEPALILLHNLYESRNQFGHVILDREALRRLSTSITKHNGAQTAYIPPRIWLYQMKRLREFLDDYNECSSGITACYTECIKLYEARFGSLDSLYSGDSSNSRDLDGSGFSRNFGTFTAYAKKHGIYEYLKKWIIGSRTTDKSSITNLGSYMSLASKVGNAYLLNLSLMRVDEAWKLRTKCLIIEDDPQFGKIYTLGGITTKRIHDTDARWVTSSSAEIAVKVLTHVVDLRLQTAKKRAGLKIPQDQINNPWFNIRQYEPWARGNGLDDDFSVRPSYPSYASVLKSYPLLLDPAEITVTETDLEYARLLTPTLGDEIEVGKVWPFAWHQLRRTGAVNMQASSLVSDASLQYQLKHSSRAMSLYYGRGYSRIKLDDVAYATYVKAMYEVLGKEITRLLTPRFVSPYGETRKAQILSVVSATEAKKLAQAAKKGQVNWRETLAGGCTKRGHCPYGGADTLVHCAGGDGKRPCVDALYDRERMPQLLELKEIISERLESAPTGSPYYGSLIMQDRAVNNVIQTLTGESS